MVGDRRHESSPSGRLSLLRPVNDANAPLPLFPVGRMVAVQKMLQCRPQADQFFLADLVGSPNRVGIRVIVQRRCLDQVLAA